MSITTQQVINLQNVTLTSYTYFYNEILVSQKKYINLRTVEARPRIYRPQRHMTSFTNFQMKARMVREIHPIPKTVAKHLQQDLSISIQNKLIRILLRL